jgi:hypothetical protein
MGVSGVGVTAAVVFVEGQFVVPNLSLLRCLMKRLNCADLVQLVSCLMRTWMILTEIVLYVYRHELFC